MKNHYYSFNDYCKERFGKKMYKVTLPGGVTCPNRDGKAGTRGCLFCSEGGSGDFCSNASLDLSTQVEEAKQRISAKLPSGEYGFIAYFQSFTSTYLPIEILRDKLMFCIERDDIEMLSVATRPDCLGDEVVALLGEVAKEKPLFIELGLQTANERTAAFIRRGYKNSVFEDALRKMKSINVPVVVHIILGLPGETREDSLNTINYINRLNRCGDTAGSIQGIKLQLLHVLKGTDLLDIYKKGEYTPLSFDEYLNLVIDCIEHLSPDICIHRLTGDGPKKILEAPLWSGDKKNVLNTMNREFRLRDVHQGSKYT